MADRPFDTPLPADLPEDWTSGQIVAPAGADVGLSQQHGYNYLMEQVNAAQRAANAINESFDSISGKRTCRFVIGTSEAGWTQADCDYLCDGTDDQAEFNAAVAAVKEVGGGEIVILDGTYHMTGMIYYGDVGCNISFAGNPGATVLELTSITFSKGGAVQRLLCFRGITFRGGSKVQLSGYSAAVESCAFVGCGFNFSDGAEVNDLMFSGNRFECGSGGTSDFSTGGGRAVLVQDNVFASESESAFKFLELGVGTIFAGNSVKAVGEKTTSVAASGKVLLQGNHFENVYVKLAASGAAAGNYLIGCTLEANGLEKNAPSIVGNKVQDGTIIADGAVNVTCNIVESGDAEAAISAVKIPYDTDEDNTPNIVGNYIIAEGVGIHLKNPASNRNESQALISGNRFYRTATPVRIESCWSGCLVTGNMFPPGSGVVDNGSDNIVRLNSDDTGGGSGGTAGVASFKGRTGEVLPQAGDYTADMVGAVPAGAVTAIQTMTQAEYDALATKEPATLYLIKE